MKRYGNLWSRICDRENIEEAANNALKGKELTKERRFFIDNRERLLDELQQSLIDESYKFSFLSILRYMSQRRETYIILLFIPTKCYIMLL